MDYYMRTPDAPDEPILLGSQSFGFFYPQQGFDLLVDLSERKPELLQYVQIVTDKGVVIQVEDFLGIFEGEEKITIRRRT